MDKEKTGRYIREKRNELKLSQAALARMIYVEPQAISKWERGQGMPDISNIEQLMEIFHCTYDDILNPVFAEPVTALTIVEDDNVDENMTALPMLRKIFDDGKEDAAEEERTDSANAKGFKARDFFSRKKFREKIRDRFGVEYENVYNQHFLFNNLWKKRKKSDYEATLSQGMFKDNTSHPTIGIEPPWLYMRVFLFLLACAVIAFAVSFINITPIYAVVFGSLVSVLPIIVFLFESNFSRNISIFDVIKIFMLGGLMSILLTLLVTPISSYNEAVGLVVIAPIFEELAKFIVAVIFINKLKPKNLLGGLLIGATVGGGFAVFETMQYGIAEYATQIMAGSLAGLADPNTIYELMFDATTQATWVIMLRTFLSTFTGHHFWSAIPAAIYVLFKKTTKFKTSELLDWKVALALIGAMLLHANWNGSAVVDNYAASICLQLATILISLPIILILINIGIAETKIIEIYEYSKYKDEEQNCTDNESTNDNTSTTFDSEPIID